MRLLVTRPEPEAGATAARLAGAGHSVLTDPMLTIVPLPDVAIPDRAYQAVLVTSVNALRAIAGHPALARLQAVELLAVGARTAGEARALGFHRVSAASGSVESLGALALARLSVAHGPLLYLAGVERAGALDAVLGAHGHAVDLVETYRSVPARALAPATRSALAEGRIDAVLFASARTASAFLAAVAAAGLRPALARVSAICLSPAIARSVAAAGFGALRVAAEASEAALIAAVGE